MTNTTRKLHVREEILASPHYQGTEEAPAALPAVSLVLDISLRLQLLLLLLIYAIQGKKFAPKAKFLKLDVADQAHRGHHGSAKSQLLTHMGSVWLCSTNVGGKHLALVSLELGSQASTPRGS